MTAWTERQLAYLVHNSVFQRKCILLVPNVAHLVAESDVLGVTPDGRLIDIEIKISRSDARADAKKDKWWHYPPYEWVDGRRVEREGLRRDWPPKIWKHYYVMPEAVYSPDLLPRLGSEKSGVVTIGGEYGRMKVQRGVTANKNAERLTAEQILYVARLANLRMWSALGRE